MEIIKSIKLFTTINVIIVFMVGCSNPEVTYPEPLSLLHKNLINYYLDTPLDLKKVDQLIEKMEDDGSWASIEYTNQQRGGWPVKEHLRNVQMLSVAYKTQGAEYFNKRAVSKKIHLSLNYWLNNDFLSPNWWDQHIGVPELLGPILFLMEDELSSDQLSQALVLMRRADIKMTGQNKVWLSGNVLFRALLLRDADSIAMASKSIQEEVNISSEEGIQKDWSYHQHGAQLQFGNYGLSYLEDMLRWYQILNKTPFAFEKNKVGILRNYILKGQRWINWKGKFDVSVCGRQIFPDEPTKKTERLNAILKTMAIIDEVNATEYQNALDYKTLSGNKHFWRSDFHVDRTNDYYFSVKMCSKRVLGAETVNQENIQGYHLGDGVTFLYQSNKEYENIFPFWDWKMLPGTTIIQDTAALPYLTAWGYHIESDFVGGVSDNINGIAVLDYNRDGLKAHKSWFMFDNKIVCLGSDIHAETEFPVATTVNQIYLGDDILMNTNNTTKSVRNLNGQVKANWILHDSTGYIFPGGANLNLQTKMLEGSWNKVAKRYRPVILTDETFKLWFNHGSNPKNASYEYVIIPNANQEKITQYEMNQPFEIRNQKNIQEVQSADKNMAGIVFYEAGKSSVFGGVKVDEPCLLMLKKQGNVLRLFVSDPTHKLKILSLTLNGKYSSNDVSCSGSQSKFNIPLPQEGDAGKTVLVTLTKNRLI